MRAANIRQPGPIKTRRAAWVGAVLLVLATSGGAFAQSAACSLVDDPHNASEKVLRCGDDLTVRAARGTRYKPIQEGQSLPTGAELDSGALMIEGRKPFQILTPHAIAAVRGTKWAVEVKAKQTSVLTVAGVIEVKRHGGKQTVSLEAGEGVDVVPGGGALEVKRWKKKRVKALLARFGE